MKNSCSMNGNASKCPVACSLHCYGELVTLLARVFMAHLFWKSGMIMYAYYISNDFGRQVEIFREGLGLPFPAFFAYATMICEIVFALLLAVGLFGRLAAIVLIIVTAIIEFSQISNIDHVYWYLILSFILVRGSGAVSLDRLFCNSLSRHCKKTELVEAPVVKAAPAQKKAAPKGKKK